jgi:hypothetical protein
MDRRAPAQERIDNDLQRGNCFRDALDVVPIYVNFFRAVGAE